MEVKAYLLRCLQQMDKGPGVVPKYVLLDVGESNAGFKAELARWMERHPHLNAVEILLPGDISWMARVWATFGRWMRWW